MLVQDVFKQSNEIKSRLEGAKSFIPYKTQVEMVDNDTFIGIEIEIERMQREAPIFKLQSGHLWDNTTDGSLRNNGREFVSVPIKGKEIPFAIEKLYTMFEKDPQCAGCTFSSRTGIHVHVNARDMEVDQLYGMLFVYVMLEDFFYSYAGQDRKDNIFCVPLKGNDKLLNLASAFDESHPYQDGVHPLRHLAERWTKYLGLNLLPLQSYGTVEFRHLKGTKSTEELLMWINMILSVKKYAVTHSLDHIKNLIESLNTTSDYLFFVQEVFGEMYNKIPIDNMELSIERSIIMLKQIFTSYREAQEAFITPETAKIINTSKYPRDNYLLNFFINSGYITPNVKVDSEKKPKGAQYIGGLADIQREWDMAEIQPMPEARRNVGGGRVRGDAPPPAPNEIPRIDMEIHERLMHERDRILAEMLAARQAQVDDNF